MVVMELSLVTALLGTSVKTTPAHPVIHIMTALAVGITWWIVVETRMTAHARMGICV